VGRRPWRDLPGRPGYRQNSGHHPNPGADELNHIATGAGAVWATSDDRGHVGVYRVDPRRNRVTSFICLQPDPIGITVAHGRVWVTEPKSGAGVVVRIDPRTNRVSGPPIGVGVGPGLIVAGAGTLWVTNSDYVSRINPSTGAVANAGSGPWGGTDPLGNAKVSMVDAVGAGSLWTTGVNLVQRLDPGNGHLTAAIAVPNAWHVIFWHGFAWALTSASSGSGIIVGIDPGSNRALGRAVLFRGAPTAIAAGPTGLWVIASNPGTSQELVHLVLDSGPH
jgi:streptogramin lyase